MKPSGMFTSAALVVCVLTPMLVLLATTGTRNLFLARVNLYLQQSVLNDDGVVSPVEEKGRPSIIAGSEVPLAPQVEGNAESPAGPPSSDAWPPGMECDFSGLRTSVCDMRGDIRIRGGSSPVTVFVSNSKKDPFKLRPYARKWEPSTMSLVKEITVRRRSPEIAPRCGSSHSVPAIVFSTGAFQGNFFHELTDVLVPLFLTSHPFHGEVQFLVVDFKSWWVEKFKPVLESLSRHRIINLDEDANVVRCYDRVVVGLRSHKELGIDPAEAPRGYSMAGFRGFLRGRYSLGRSSCVDGRRRGKRQQRMPRLVLMSRERSRALRNERELVETAAGLGFDVAVVRPGMTRNLSKVAEVVNSADVMVGVHGAGLTNMVFLPTGATVVQIVPWGGLMWACRYTFGEPAVGMGLRYLEYEVAMEESSLTERYPRNHTVFRDPLAIHRQGYVALWSLFLDKQNVTVNLSRLAPVLSQALHTYT